MENVLLCQSLILQDLIDAVIPYEKIKPVEPLPTPPTDPEVSQLFFLISTLVKLKTKIQIPSKLCQKIGYGKTFLHINIFFYCCPLISL